MEERAEILLGTVHNKEDLGHIFNESFFDGKSIQELEDFLELIDSDTRSDDEAKEFKLRKIAPIFRTGLVRRIEEMKANEAFLATFGTLGELKTFRESLQSDSQKRNLYAGAKGLPNPDRVFFRQLDRLIEQTEGKARGIEPAAPLFGTGKFLIHWDPNHVGAGGKKGQVQIAYAHSETVAGTIRFIQIVRTDKNGPSIIDPQSRWHIDFDETKPGTWPWYQFKGQGGGGTHASITDEMDSTLLGGTQYYESVAIVADGPKRGKILGSVTWSVTTPPIGGLKKMEGDGENINRSAPSEKFLELVDGIV